MRVLVPQGAFGDTQIARFLDNIAFLSSIVWLVLLMNYASSLFKKQGTIVPCFWTWLSIDLAAENGNDLSTRFFCSVQWFAIWCAHVQ